MAQPWDALTIKFSSPPVDRTAIEAASRKVKLPFPPEYVAFLLAHNGGQSSRGSGSPSKGAGPTRTGC